MGTLMSVSRRTFVTTLAAAPLASLLARPALAAYPDRSIRLIVPFAAGGNADFVARLTSEGMSQALGQPSPDAPKPAKKKAKKKATGTTTSDDNGGTATVDDHGGSGSSGSGSDDGGSSGSGSSGSSGSGSDDSGSDHSGSGDDD